MNDTDAGTLSRPPATSSPGLAADEAEQEPDAALELSLGEDGPPVLYLPP